MNDRLKTESMEVILNLLFFGDLPIINEQMLFTKLPVDRWNNNILKRLKVSSIKLSFDNGIYVSNTRNAYFNNLPFMVIKFWSLDEEYIV